MRGMGQPAGGDGVVRGAQLRLAASGNAVARPSGRDGAGLSRRAVLAAAVGATCGVSGASARTAAPITLGRGVNLWPWFSLTREYPAPRIDYAWPPYEMGRPVPRGRDLARLRAAGFDFVRIPADPGPLLAFDGGRRAALLDDISAAAASAVAEGLSTVVCLLPNTATHHYTPDFMIGSPQAPGFPAYLDVVDALAARLGTLDSTRVAFEPVNEPPQPCGSVVWRSVQEILLGAARVAAPRLALVASGACGSAIAGLDALDPAPLLALGPVLFTFHFYEPFLFTHQGAPWMTEPVYRALNAVPWPASAGSLARTLDAVRRQMDHDAATPAAAKAEAYRTTERALAEYFAAEPDIGFIRTHMEPARSWAARHGIPADQVVLGEFGALPSTGRIVAAAAADRARYLRDVRETAETMGFPWCLWALFDVMGIMDDTTHALDPDMLRALGLTVG